MNFSQLNFGFFALKIYGMILSVAFAVATWIYYRRLPEHRLSQAFFLHHYWRWLLGGLLLGRLLTVIIDPTIFDRFGFMAFFAFWDGEINIWGGAFGFMLTMYLDLKKADQAVRPWYDAGVLPFLVAAMIADWAAFLTGKIYGIETSLPWGIQYETFGVEILNPVHPVTLYAFVAHFLLWWWAREHEKRWQKTPGVLALKTMFYFLLVDFFLQFLHGNQELHLGYLNINQYFALVGIFITVYWLYGDRQLSHAFGTRIRRPRRQKNNP